MKVIQEQGHGGHGGHGGYSAPAPQPQLVKLIVEKSHGGHGGHGGYSAPAPAPVKIVKVNMSTFLMVECNCFNCFGFLNSCRSSKKKVVMEVTAHHPVGLNHKLHLDGHLNQLDGLKLKLCFKRSTVFSHC